MNLFQSLVLALFAGLATFTISAGVRGLVRKRIVLFWLSVWTAGSVAIIWPHSTALVAHALGIGRGADLVLYSSVLVMFIAFFYVYTRFRRMDRQLTLLVRRLAMQNANQVLPPLSAADLLTPLPAGDNLPALGEGLERPAATLAPKEPS